MRETSLFPRLLKGLAHSTVWSDEMGFVVGLSRLNPKLDEDVIGVQLEKASSLKSTSFGSVEGEGKS
jgi:hypothetical protein